MPGTKRASRADTTRSPPALKHGQDALPTAPAGGPLPTPTPPATTAADPAAADGDDAGGGSPAPPCCCPPLLLERRAPRLLLLLLLSDTLAVPPAAAAEGVLLLLPEGQARLVQSAMMRTRPTNRWRSLRAARKPWMHSTCSNQSKRFARRQQRSAAAAAASKQANVVAVCVLGSNLQSMPAFTDQQAHTCQTTTATNGTPAIYVCLLSTTALYNTYVPSHPCKHPPPPHTHPTLK